MELIEINIYKIGREVGKDILKENLANEVLYKYIIRQPKRITISNITFYEILNDIMEEWLGKKIGFLNVVVPDLHKLSPEIRSDGSFALRDVEEDMTKTYPIEEIMKIYGWGLPMGVFSIAKALTYSSDFVLEYYKDVLTEWKCYNFEVFREELTKNPKKALQRYITAIHIIAYNLPVIILISTKKIEK